MAVRQDPIRVEVPCFGPLGVRCVLVCCADVFPNGRGEIGEKTPGPNQDLSALLRAPRCVLWTFPFSPLPLSLLPFAPSKTSPLFPFETFSPFLSTVPVRLEPFYDFSPEWCLPNSMRWFGVLTFPHHAREYKSIFFQRPLSPPLPLLPFSPSKPSGGPWVGETGLCLRSAKTLVVCTHHTPTPPREKKIQRNLPPEHDLECPPHADLCSAKHRKLCV